MKLLKLFFVLTFLFNSTNLFSTNSTKLTSEIITKKEVPNFETVTKFFEEKKLLVIFYSNLNENQKNSWLGHKEDLIQELFEGILTLNAFAKNNNQIAIDLVAVSLNTLFGSSWQDFYKQ